MIDPRTKQLAHNLINYSTSLKEGEKILIEAIGEVTPLAQALIEATYEVKALPFLWVRNNRLQKTIVSGATPEQLELMAKWDAEEMSEMDAYIGIWSPTNVSETSDVPSDKMANYQRLYNKKVHSDIRVKNTKWCILRFPNDSMAQLANMSSDAFEDLYYKVVNLDYSKMDKTMDPLVRLMQNTDKVRIIGNGTDLSFSIKGIPVQKCSGKRNIPDGEVYTAPVRDSINGCISYNTPSLYHGSTFENTRFVFKNGKIVEASSNNTAKTNAILDTDEGARYVGEFAIGLNPYIKEPMKNTLFDEKINGSFHLTPGNAYDIAFNGNTSAIHWDLVCIQTPEYGGGEIWFDDVLIRKDGRFVLDELSGLNPENLE